MTITHTDVKESVNESLTYQGNVIATPGHQLGELATTPATDSADKLHSNLQQNGYLLIKNFFDRHLVLEAGKEIYRRLGNNDQLDPNFPVEEGVAAASESNKMNATSEMISELAKNNPSLDAVIHGRQILSLFERIFAKKEGLTVPVKYLDFTWMRAKRPGVTTSTNPHCDIVYMGRGTHKLLTAWTPFCDIPLEMGGLMILENSHKLTSLKETYGKIDIDTYCENTKRTEPIISGEQWAKTHSAGAYDTDAVHLPKELGGRWLTSNYKAGDLLIFTMFTMHSSSDNTTNKIRISTDTRYQPKDEPVDERWIGENPIAHGSKAKRGLIC